ncbi:MAG: hypothetical protein BWY94_01188 [Actinobacteria bacterium ADurb.BinA094]|nr:MAG: hypothetical protein BWY94_01188 [Actinobacteria bacterium ADurb.BinA094]
MALSPVPARVSMVRTGARLGQSGTRRSMPMTAMWVRGRVVDMRPLPSFVTSTTVPVAATPRLTPEIPTSALRNLSRSTRRANAASASTSSGSSSPATSENRARISGSRLCRAGPVM